MANLADTAQMTMDLFYQNVKTDEDFFILDHFIYLAGVAYSKILEDEYKLARREAKQDMGNTMADVFLQDDWLVEKKVKVKKDPEGQDGVFVAELPHPVFSFPFDPYGFGIQYVRRVGKTGCNQFIRTSVRESWMDCRLPKVKNRAFFYLAGQTLRFTNVYCPLDEISILMIPEITDLSFGEDGGPIPKSKEDDIIRKTMEIVRTARDGVVVDMSNNSNPNKAMQTEVDSLFQNLRTKPI